MVAIKGMEMPSCCGRCDYSKSCKHHYMNIYSSPQDSNCPLVEVEERKVGKWKSDGHGHIVCTACNEVNVSLWKSKYCPCCGAEMRGNKDDNDISLPINPGAYNSF